MFKLKEYNSNSHSFFSISISNEWDEPDSNYNLYHFAIFKKSWWFKGPKLVSPKKKWVDLSNMEWAKPNKDGSKGYWDSIRKCYGISFNDEAIHVYYGIQPMSWSANDPENSDHTKLYNYFWNLQHVRHSAYDINGNYLCNGTHLREWTYKYLPKYCKPYNAETKDIDFQTVPWFIYPKNDKIEKWPPFKDGYDNFDSVSSNIEVFKFYEYIDKYDNSKTIARVNIEEREWIRGKWKWLRAILKFIPGCVFIRRTIDVEFRDEVGSEKGSWKGGTLGCGFNMLPNETIDECFNRFQKEWK